MDPKTEARMQHEHREKYDRLIEILGEEDLKKLLPVELGRIRRALDEGDEHLNSIPLQVWDRAAGVRSIHTREVCPTCGHKQGFIDHADWPYSELRRTARDIPWCRFPQLSLAERVCVLKRLAVRLAEVTP